MRQPHVVAEEKPDATTQPAPLKHLDIRIPDANGGVTVRVHERAGGVQVSVRTSDAQIAGNIAETLPDLTRQLGPSRLPCRDCGHPPRKQLFSPNEPMTQLPDQAHHTRNTFTSNRHRKTTRPRTITGVPSGKNSRDVVQSQYPSKDFQGDLS